MEQFFNLTQENALAISSAILIIAYIFIAWEKISKVIIALLGGSLTLFLCLISSLIL